MKKINQSIRAILFSIISMLFIQCSSDDDSSKEPIPIFSESEKALIHGGFEQSWRITEVINKYYNPNYHLEIELPCLYDDVYTFHASQDAVTVNLGESRCFQQNDDGVFTANIEIFEANLTYMNIVDTNSNTIFLQIIRGYSNEDGTAFSSTSRWYKLAELTENRMVFHRSGGQFIGEYNEALIFEKIN